MFHSVIPFIQAHGLTILGALVLAVMVTCWVVGSRKDKTAADRILIERGLKESQTSTKQVDDLLKRELKQQRKTPSLKAGDAT